MKIMIEVGDMTYEFRPMEISNSRQPLVAATAGKILTAALRAVADRIEEGSDGQG